jgi:hypothetical protein
MSQRDYSDKTAIRQQARVCADVREDLMPDIIEADQS